MDSYVQEMWPKYSSYRSSYDTATKDAVIKPNDTLIRSFGSQPIGDCAIYGGTCGDIWNAQTGSGFVTGIKELLGTIAPPGAVISRFENSQFMQFLSKNIPGVQAFSINHDIAMGQLQYYMGENAAFMAINVSTIPVWAYAQYQALGVSSTAYQLRLMRE